MRHHRLTKRRDRSYKKLASVQPGSTTVARQSLATKLSDKSPSHLIGAIRLPRDTWQFPRGASSRDASLFEKFFGSHSLKVRGGAKMDRRVDAAVEKAAPSRCGQARQLMFDRPQANHQLVWALPLPKQPLVKNHLRHLASRFKIRKTCSLLERENIPTPRRR